MILIPSASDRRPELDGHRRAAEADAFHVGGMRRREIGMVEQRRQEDRRARPAADVVRTHHLERMARVPAIDEVDVAAAAQRSEHGAEHPGGVRDRRAHQVGRVGHPSGHVLELAQHRAMVVDHTLRIARRAGRVGEHGDLVRGGDGQVDDRFERCELVPTDATDAVGRRRLVGAVAISLDHHVQAQTARGRSRR